MKNKTRLNPWFITGLVEGEGCFTVSFSLRRKLKIGVETRPSFSISLNQRDLDLLKKVHDYFGCGAIRYSKGDRTYKFETRSTSDMTRMIIPHFQKYPLIGSKAKDFDIFAGICIKVQANQHMNRGILAGIIQDAYRMNPSGKRRIDKGDLLRELGELKV